MTICLHGSTDPLTCKTCVRVKESHEDFIWKKSWKFSKKLYNLKKTIMGSSKDIKPSIQLA